ncbi:MAG: DUF4199 domain-containing protein [Balneolaceae bacterium]|nr:DUF4199 domain-containing protein [Balneolaceae bacterium]
MDSTEHQSFEPEPQDNGLPSYWRSVGIAAVIFSLVTFAMQIITGYIQINSEPSGSLFSPAMFLNIILCLVGAFGGLVAVWHFVREYNVSLKLGKGALIGFLTGTAIVLIGVVLNEVWNLIDPDYSQQLIDSMIANYEQLDLPDDTRQQMIDQVAQQANPTIGSQLLWGIPSFGILNLLTGMIGAKVFGKEEQQEF